MVVVSTNGNTFAASSTIPQILPDTLDLSRSMPPVAWTLFRDSAQTVAPPMGGREPGGWMRLPIYGHPNGYAQWTTLVIDGQVYIDRRDGRVYEGIYPPSVNDDNPAALIVPTLQGQPLRGGPRGTAIGTGFSVTRGHSRKRRDGTINPSPHLPLWISIDMLGGIWYLMRDGSMSIAGRVALSSRSYVNDFSFWDYVAPDGTDMRSVFWITDTAAGKIIRAQRVHDPVSRTDRFDTQVWAQVSGRATSVRAVGRKLYVCNEAAVIEIDGLDRTMPPRTVCTLADVFFVDHTSDGKLVVITRWARVHRVDPVTGRIGPNLSGWHSDPAAGLPSKRGWVMLEVDRNGSVGPRDTIYACASHADPINGPWVIRPDDTLVPKPGAPWLGNGGTWVGDARYTAEAMHYAWNVTIHPDEGLMCLWGGAQLLPSIYAAVNPADGWTTFGVGYDYAVMLKGVHVLTWGGVVMNAQPTFMSQMHGSGGSLLGCSVDHIALMEPAQAEAFVRQGMLSTLPRALPADYMRGFLYLCYRNSERFLREGRPLLDRLGVYLAQSART